MKICYISSTYFSDSDLGILKDLSKENEVCYGIVIPCKNNNYSLQQLDETINGCSKTLIKKEVFAKGRLRNPLNMISYFKWLKEIRINKYDIIYINNTEDLFLSIALFLFIGKKTFIYGVHDALHHSGWRKNMFMKKANEMMISKSNSLLAFSNSQSAILSNGFPQKQIFTIPLALKDFGQDDNSSLNYNVINFLFFGNIVSYKGLDILLKAVKILASKYKNFKVTIAGRCNNWATDYEPLIDSEMPVDTHVRFIDNSEIPHFFSAAHYLVLPYRDVTQSGPLMIGYNYSLPVLASRLEGFTEFLEHGKTGYLFEPNDIPTLVQVMEAAILRNIEDYMILKNNTSVFAHANFGTKTIAAKYMQMFCQVAPGVV